MACEVRGERSHFRDEPNGQTRPSALSLRHRLWGWNVPAVNIDLLLEYDSRKAVAIVEYKGEAARPVPGGDSNLAALRDLCERAYLPLFLVRYADDFSWLKVRPANTYARLWLEVERLMTEEEWVTLGYRLRGRHLPADVGAILRRTTPPAPSQETAP